MAGETVGSTGDEREMPVWFKAWIHQAADEVIKTLGGDRNQQQAVIEAIWRKAGPYIRPIARNLDWLKEFEDHMRENGCVCEKEEDQSVGIFLCSVCHPDGWQDDFLND
jgi:hypothetical protein